MNLEIRLKNMMIAAQNGDNLAYNALLMQLSSWLRVRAKGLFARHGQPHEDVEDMVQEVLLALHLKRHTWLPQEPFLPWVAAILRYKLIDKLRKKMVSTEFLTDNIINSFVDETPEQPDYQSHFKQLVVHLPAQQQEMMQLLIEQGFSQQQVATQLNMSEGAIRVNVHRAIKKLSALFSQNNR